MQSPILWRLRSWLLARRLPPVTGRAVLGDLLEEYAVRAAADGRWRAETWLLSECASLSRSFTAASRRAALISVGHDIRLAVRSLWSQPFLALAIVVPVALAVAANTALFSILDGLLFRPLPFAHADEIVQVSWRPKAFGQLQFDEHQRIRQTLEATPLLAATSYGMSAGQFRSTGEEFADLRLFDVGVSPGFFAMLGVSPALGREFAASEASERNSVPLILGDHVWRAAFHADEFIVGRVVDFAGQHARIVGVMPPGFDFPAGANLWSVPTPGITSQLRGYARLAPGVRIEQLAGAFPLLEFVPLRRAMQPKGTETLAFLLTAAGVLLLVAWVQVAGLVFSRAVGRVREIGVRLALGAPRWRLTRQFVIESLTITTPALAFAWIATPPLTRLVAEQLPVAMMRGQHVDPDFRALLFACALSLIGVLALTLLPLRLVRNVAPLDLVRGSSPGAGSGASKTRSTLLVGQVAFTVLLVYLSGLALKSFDRVHRVDYGFDTQHVVQFYPPEQPLPASATAAQRIAARVQRQARIDETVATLHGIATVAGVTTTSVPLVFPGGGYGQVTVPSNSAFRPIRARVTNVGREFFETIGARFVAGSGFGSTADGGPAAVVNESLARRLEAVGSPLGSEIQAVAARGRVVGIVKDFIDYTPGIPAEPQAFIFEQNSTRPLVLIRLQGDGPAAESPALSALQRQWDGGGRVRLRPVADDLAQATMPWRARARLLGLIAGLCLPLGLIGIVGASSYWVRTHTREIAIRVALGATPPSVGRLVVRRAVTLACAGTILGVGIGILLARAAATQLFEITPADPQTIAGVTMLLILAAALAAMVPARRASHIEPAMALKDL